MPETNKPPIAQSQKRQKLIGDILIEQGVVTPAQLRQALESQKVSSKLVGQILVDLGMISPQQLQDALASQKTGVKLIGDLLIEQNVITAAQLHDALEERKTSTQAVCEILKAHGWATDEQINYALAVQAGIPTLDLPNYLIEADIAHLIPQELARKYQVIPVSRSGDFLVVAMSEPTNVFIVDELRQQTGCTIEPHYAPAMDVLRAIDVHYGAELSLRDVLQGVSQSALSSKELDEQGVTVKLVNTLIVQAVKQSASDIHVEPEEKEVGIRYRIDGILYRIASLPKSVQAPLLSRLKVMAELDIAERRLPQDGRVLIKVSDKEIDMRVSTQPTVFGENIVLRILDRSTLRMRLEDLGFDEEESKALQSMISLPYGIILATGPTGSGKTTTLYTLLQRLNKEDVNIMTVEDPVEYTLPLIRQTQIHPKAGLTYAQGLRAILRQDPDVIMVGEIRDLETAQIAVRAALTGHLVFSTLHTNNAASVFTRLTDMGVEPFLVSSSLIGILAQRLIRRICEHCKERVTPPVELLQQLGFSMHIDADNAFSPTNTVILHEQPKFSQRIDADTAFFRGSGCALCQKTGYRGRIAIVELLRNTPQIQKLALRKASADEIAQAAMNQGMRTVREAAIRKLLQGVTTFEEVFRVTLEEAT